MLVRLVSVTDVIHKAAPRDQLAREAAADRAAIRVDLDAIFVSFELSKSTWLVTPLSPCSEKTSRHLVVGGDLPALLTCLGLLREKARAGREGSMP